MRKKKYSPVKYSVPIEDENEIKSLKTLLDTYKIKESGSVIIKDMTSRLETKYEKALKDVHHYKLFPLKDGRWKTNKPQMIKKSRFDLLEALYNYYFHADSLIISDLFDAWIKEFKKDVELGHRSVNSYDRYKSDWERFFKGTELSRMNITEVKISNIKNHYKRLTAHGALTRRGLNNAKTILNHVFDYAADNDMIPYNIARGINTKDLYCKEDNNEFKVYTDEEREKIIKQALKEDDVFARAIILMFCSCTRVGEIRAIKWEDVNFEERTVYIHREIVRRKDEFGKEIFVCVNHTKSKLAKGNRYQPLSDLAIKVLKAQRRSNPFGEFVFMYDDKTLNTNTINHHLRRICEAAKVPYLSSHKIRFWSVTNMYVNGVDQASIQKMAGHADPATTNHYKRVSRIKDIGREEWNEMFG